MRHMKLHILQVYSPKFIRHITRYKEFTENSLCSKRTVRRPFCNAAFPVTCFAVTLLQLPAFYSLFSHKIIFFHCKSQKDIFSAEHPRENVFLFALLKFKLTLITLILSRLFLVYYLAAHNCQFRSNIEYFLFRASEDIV